MGGDPPVMVATTAGRLDRLEKLHDGGVEAVAFVLSGAAAAFVLAPVAFEGAGFHESERSTLVLRLRGLRTWIAGSRR